MSKMIWVKPSWWREFDEFLCIITHLRVWPHVLVWKYCRGQLMELDDDTWKKLKDTDSWRTTDMSEVGVVQQDRQEMDWDPYPISDKLYRAFTDPSSTEVFAPIIIRLPCGDTHLVAGNRRLMLARAHDIRPTCFLL